MSKLEDLVPPLELCKQIPEGEFADSALVWMVLPDGSLHPVFPIIARDATLPDDDIIPAPTLAEIMVALDAAGWYCPTAYYQVNTWKVDCESDPVDEEFNSLPTILDAEDKDNAATAALKLWLEVNK